MARRVFFSFHYIPDHWRASQVRNIGSIDGNKAATDNDWETVKKGGDAAIKKWIDGQLDGRSCTVVLIGKDTANRKWINYEIEKSWQDGKGVVGIHVHNLKDSTPSQSTKGANPFAGISVGNPKKALSSIAKTYDPPYTESTKVYDHIKNNLETWIEEAVKIRNAN
jgi:hypothetical protein